MRAIEIIPILSVVLAAVGCWLMLPHRHGQAKPRTVHIVGFSLAAIGILMLVTLWTPPGPFLSSFFFYAFGITAIVAGLLMITSRDPIYSALWFAAVVLSTSGLFLLTGAQFLAAGTVIVYAGAIVVTFLFVIMLAQSGGQALYDRTARAPGRATLACFLLLWSLLYALLTVQHPPPAAGEAPATAPVVLATTGQLAAQPGLANPAGVAAVVDQAVRRNSARIRTQTVEETPKGVPVPHVAGIGATLYTDHLITVEIVGTILFVALVGAAAIATPKKPVRPTTVGR